MVWLKNQYGVLKFSTSLVIECMLPFPTPTSENVDISLYPFAVREHLYVEPHMQFLRRTQSFLRKSPFLKNLKIFKENKAWIKVKKSTVPGSMY